MIPKIVTLEEAQVFKTKLEKLITSINTEKKQLLIACQNLLDSMITKILVFEKLQEWLVKLIKIKKIAF